MRGLARQIIGIAGLLLFLGGLAGGVAIGVQQLILKIGGAAFSGAANDVVGLTVFGLLGGIAWLLASIDRRLEDARKEG